MLPTCLLLALAAGASGALPGEVKPRPPEVNGTFEFAPGYRRDSLHYNIRGGGGGFPPPLLAYLGLPSCLPCVNPRAAARPDHGPGQHLQRPLDRALDRGRL